MSDSEDYSGLLESKIECISRKVAKEEIEPCANAVEAMQKDLSDIQKAAIALLITILLAVLGYFGTKIMDRQLDRHIRAEALGAEAVK
jgi:hypothetical protein